MHEWLASPVIFEIVLLVISFVVGAFGAILGLGGGVVLVPLLTLGFGINIRYAIGASIVSVIATSSGAAATYVRDHVTNIRVAMLLEVATTCGALGGALVAAYVNTRFLFAVFAAILVYSAYAMVRGRAQDAAHAPLPADRLSARLALDSKYPDKALGRDVPYTVHRVKTGFVLMLGAGLISGLLGVGSGVLKVPAMDRAMGLPIKVSSATSNFMIGVTAAASAGTYFMRGDILPSLAAPVAIGVFGGSLIGTRLLMIAPSRHIRIAFVLVLIVVAAEMGLRAWGMR